MTLNPDFLHQNHHISAPDKARIFNESSLKSSDFTLSGDSIHFGLLTQKTQSFYEGHSCRHSTTYMCKLTFPLFENKNRLQKNA
jgi:hypothetical protein